MSSTASSPVESARWEVSRSVPPRGHTARYARARARVEAKAALEQAEELRRILEALGGRLGE